MRVLIVGCGFVGLPLGTELVRQGHEVFGLRRSRSAESSMREAGIQPVFADITLPESLAGLPRGHDWVVNCAAPGGGGADEYYQLYLAGNRNLLDWLSPAPPRKYVYTSSTGVYGQDDGSLVDETSPVLPAGEPGKVLVAAEDVVLNAFAANQFPAVILRVAGIYGAGRGHWLKQFLAGDARLEGNGARFLNMIHRDDVIGCVIAALNQGRPGSVLNAADNEPVSQLEMFRWLSARLNKPLPPARVEGPMETRRRSATNKRVSNLRLRRETGYSFKYPTFREGFAAELAQLGVEAGS